MESRMKRNEDFAEKAYQVFKSMGEGRNLKALAKQLGVDGRTIRAMSNRYRWEEKLENEDDSRVITKSQESNAPDFPRQYITLTPELYDEKDIIKEARTAARCVLDKLLDVLHDFEIADSTKTDIGNLKVATECLDKLVKLIRDLEESTDGNNNITELEITWKEQGE